MTLEDYERGCDALEAERKQLEEETDQIKQHGPAYAENQRKWRDYMRRMTLWQRHDPNYVD